MLQTVERVPGANEKVVALDTRVEAGGPALNAAVTAALLGMPSRLLTAVGPSPLGAVVRADCGAHGVDLVDAAEDGFVVPVSTVLVTASTGARAVVSRNAVGSPAVTAPEAAVLAGVLRGVSAVLVDGHHLGVATEVARRARQHGIPVLADAGSWKPGLEVLLAHVDVLVASADFHVRGGHGAPGLEDLIALGPRWVARTTGGGPVRWMAADGTTGEVPVRQVRVVDTLGAGDVLHGALLADVGRRGAGDLPGSLAVAVEVATRSVTAEGARGWARPGVRRQRRSMAGAVQSVDEYLGRFSGEVRERLDTMRSVITSTAPDAVESMAYGMPAYKLDGKPLVYFAGYDKHVGFYATPNGHEAFAEEFAGYTQGKGSVQFPHDRSLPTDLVRRVVEFRVAALRG